MKSVAALDESAFTLAFRDATPAQDDGHTRAPPALVCRQAGFTLLEIICVVAVIAMLAAIVLPAIPVGTSRPRLQGYALETAALLKADRTAAMRRRSEVATVVDAPRRTVRSGLNGRTVRMPA